MSTARGLHALELLQKCAQCNVQFQEKWNVGRFLCRVHPDRTGATGGISFVAPVLNCCNHPFADNGFASEPGIQTQDQIGCLPCDHSASRGDDAPVVSIFPLFYMTREFISNGSPENTILTVTGDVLRTALEKSQDPMFSVVTWKSKRQVSIHLVDVAFRLLMNHVSSPFYDIQHVPEFKDIRDRFEKLIDQTMVTTSWDCQRDTTDVSTERISDVSAREMLASEALDRQYLTPNKFTRQTPACRIALVRQMMKRNDTGSLLRVMIPFVVVRRQALEQDEVTLDIIKKFNSRPRAVHQYNVKVGQ